MGDGAAVVGWSPREMALSQDPRTKAGSSLAVWRKSLWAEEMARNNLADRKAFTWGSLAPWACARICLVELGGIWNILVASRNAQLRLLDSKYIKRRVE